MPRSPSQLTCLISARADSLRQLGCAGGGTTRDFDPDLRPRHEYSSNSQSSPPHRTTRQLPPKTPAQNPNGLHVPHPPRRRAAPPSRRAPRSSRRAAHRRLPHHAEALDPARRTAYASLLPSPTRSHLANPRAQRSLTAPVRPTRRSPRAHADPSTANDPVAVPECSPSHGSYHWSFERLLAVGLVPLTVAPFAAGSLHPIADATIAAVVIMHSHMGFQYASLPCLPARPC